MKAPSIIATTIACLMCGLAGVSAQAAELDAYGGFTDVKGEKTGFFHTQETGGRWWLVTPEGHGFFGIGLSHPVTSFSQGAVTFAYNGDIEKLNAIYEKNYRSWDDLRRRGGLSYPEGYFQYSDNEMIAADQKALLAEIVERVHKLGHTEIRKVDSNHMVLGCYVKGVTYPPEIWNRIRPYIDVLAPQHFSETNKIKPQVKNTGLPALLSDQVFGNVYPESLLSSPRSPGPVSDHLDRRVLYHLLSRRLAADPDFIGASFCACLHDNSHWIQPYDRGQPGFFTIDNEPRSKTIETVKESNALIYQSVRRPLDDTAIRKLDDDYHKTIAAYKAIARISKRYLTRMALPVNLAGLSAALRAADRCG